MQTNKFPSAKFKGFPSLNEAENFLRENGVSEIKNYISRSPPRNFFSPKSPKSSKQQIQSKKNVGQSIKSDVSQPSANLDNLWNTTENSVLLDETPCLQADPDSQYTLVRLYYSLLRSKYQNLVKYKISKAYLRISLPWVVNIYLTPTLLGKQFIVTFSIHVIASESFHILQLMQTLICL